MKPMSLASVLNPGVLVMGIVIAAVSVITLTGARVPLLSNLRLSLVVVLVLGMAMCAQGGIGPVATAKLWGHPQAIVGYVLGALILIYAAAAFFSFKLPFSADSARAFLIVVVLIGLKVVNSVAHSLLARG